MDKVGAVGQQSLDDVDVHFVAVPADRVIAVNIPVTVHKILHITAILFAVDFDLLEINCFCFGKQGEKFFRHVLCRFNVMRVFAPLKKREGLCQLLSCRFTFYWFIIIYHHKGIVFSIVSAIDDALKISTCKFDMIWYIIGHSNNPLTRLTASSFFWLMILAYTCVIFTSAWPSSLDVV